ncbi:MAG: COX15/CtaA family protein [Alphaproteobacteria bacterium]|jgi:cytochrome c oxidase assembly protein subunit 15|nr:COX15/CtaA family protein [Alphaproteobacteria bacterium]
MAGKWVGGRSFERGLWVCLVMVFVMIILGGVTRLTGSGLSIVEWKLVTGVLPPLTETDWQLLFDEYKTSPQFQKINYAMDLDAFKGIFWLEFIHRLWGRLLGLMFLWPLSLCFIHRTLLPYKGRLVTTFVLGGLQGVLGWYMVRSGLVDHPEVSHYRLAAHFLMGVLTYGLILWTLVEVKLLRGDLSAFAFPRIPLWGLLGLLGLTSCYGALTAGLKGGLAYDTFPLVAGAWLPTEFDQRPFNMLTLLDAPGAVQWIHRTLGVLTVGGLAWLLGYAKNLTKERRALIYALFGLGLLQMTLGIATIVSHVNITLAALHQGGALLIVSGVITLLVLTKTHKI